MREKENLTLLGNQQTEYSMDYNPSVLEAFQNKHPEMIILSSLTAPNLQAFVRLPDSRTLQRSQFLMFRMNVLWRVNP